MIELIVEKFLNNELNVPAYLEMPEKNPDSFVLIEKTNSNEKNKLDSSVLVFQSYAKTLYSAAALNEEVKKALKRLESINEIVSVKLNSDYNFTDTTTKKYRYQAVYNITHY